MTFALRCCSLVISTGSDSLFALGVSVDGEREGQENKEMPLVQGK